jgi:hypothetical protein
MWACVARQEVSVVVQKTTVRLDGNVELEPLQSK